MKVSAKMFSVCNGSRLYNVLERECVTCVCGSCAAVCVVLRFM